MSVVNQVILLENVACVWGHEAWEVGAIEAPVQDVEEVPVMGMGAGAIVPVEKDHHDAAVYHLAVVTATAGLRHIAMPAMIPLMLTEINSETKTDSELKGIMEALSEM